MINLETSHHFVKLLPLREHSVVKRAQNHSDEKQG